MHRDGHSPNYDFVTDTALSLAATPDARILDFGCGRGTWLEIALRRNLSADLRGVDSYAGMYADWVGDLPESLRDRVTPIVDGRIPFPDGHFDVVVSNQVFEHIAEPAASVAEIARVLKRGGAFLALFPTVDVWFEGHVGVYFAHRFRDPRWQRRYLRAMKALGFGYHTEGYTADAWAAHTTATLQEACFYHTKRDVDRWWAEAFGAPPASLALDYMRFRLAVHPRLRALAWLCDNPLTRPLVTFACHRRAGRVLVARKR